MRIVVHNWYDAGLFNASKHPRANNGQFGSGGGTPNSTTHKSYGAKPHMTEEEKAAEKEHAERESKRKEAAGRRSGARSDLRSAVHGAVSTSHTRALHMQRLAEEKSGMG